MRSQQANKRKLPKESNDTLITHKMTRKRILMRNLLFGAAVALLQLLSCSPLVAHCKPNYQQSLGSDKQLLRKALDETSSGGVGGGGGSGSSRASDGASQFQCPEQFGYYTDARDCTKYFVCVFGEVLHESCTGGLRFSKELQTCDWPRNVDCKNQVGNETSGQQSTTATTSTATTMSASTATSSSLAQSTSTSPAPPTMQAATAATPTTSTSTTTQSSSSQSRAQSAQDRLGANSAKPSLVFADEGSDPQQPSFDEAVSPLITPDGTIHLHDGSGGTFSLTPNHNRAQAAAMAARGGPVAGNQDDGDEGASAEQSDVRAPQPPHSVSVFVRPLHAAAAAADANRRQFQAASRAQQQPPQQSPQPNSFSHMKLQAATLPAAKQRLAPNQFRPPAQRDAVGAAREQPAASLADDLADLGASGGQPPSDSIGDQADQESSENQPGAGGGAEQPEPAGGADYSADSLGESDEPNDQTQLPPTTTAATISNGYIPPVLVSSNGNAAPRQQAARPSSQLLSVNNRQIVDAARQTFKPILAPTSAPQPEAFNQRFPSSAAAAATVASRANQRQQQQLGGNESLGNNQRQSRTSQQQQAAAQHFQANPNRFLPHATDNSVNFNDSSKLIRLQASQNGNLLQSQFFGEPMSPANTFPRFPTASSSSTASTSARSQLQGNFAAPQQSPFGFSADASLRASNVPLDQLDGLSSLPLSGASQSQAAAAQRGFGGQSQAAQPLSLQQQQRRPRPPKRHQIPNGGGAHFQPPAQTTFSAATTPTTLGATQPTTASTLAGQSFGDEPPANEQVAPPPPPTRQSARQLAGPATVNFDQPDGGGGGGGTSPPLRQWASAATGNAAGQEQRNQQLQSIGRRPQAASAPLPPAAGQQQPVAATAAASLPSEQAANTNQPDQTELVANRYLNSAIDALEAGQPFGTVDYDFDILSDNSTERRNPPATAAAAASNQPPPQPTPPSAPSSTGAARQRQSAGRQAASGGAAANRQSGAFAQPNAPTTVAQQPAAPTKKPRPTNKKIVVDHEQALANNRASVEPARRPEPLFQTPQALQTATKCDTRLCKLPDCKCGDTLVPANLDSKAIPQIVLLTFDDAVNDLNWEIYEELFSGRTNPNGCPVLATFYVSHEWTDYGQVQTLYSRGHEMASHSVTHSFGEKFSKSQWFKEVNGQREILNMYGGVKMNDVRGMRAPFLQIGGNKMFEMLYDANFTYDSSMPIFENSPPLWPYTLDYQLAHECMITPCPTKSFPGVWEVGMTMWVDLRGGRCSMGDACSNPPDEDGVYEMLMKNFNRHYKSNRAPFGLFYHSAWFNTVHHRRGFLRFMANVNSFPDVFFVTNWQMIQWMRQPTPMSEINSFEPWQCPAKSDRPPPCNHPSVCNVKSEHGTRFMKTCQPCPANQQYPWVGATGFKSAKQSGSGR